jgi:hypothetical protein
MITSCRSGSHPPDWSGPRSSPRAIAAVSPSVASALVPRVSAPCSSRSRRQGRIRRLQRVVNGLAVVRVRAGLEQNAGELRVVHDAGRSVQGRHLAVLVREGRVRVGAERQKLTDELDLRIDGVAGVEDRRPVPRPARPARIAVPSAAEHEPGPRVALDLGPRSDQLVRALAPPTRRRLDERVDACLGGGDEHRPASISVLPGEHQLRARENRLAPAQPPQRGLVTGPRGLDELLRLLSSAVRDSRDLPPSARVRGVGRRRDRIRCDDFRGGRCPARGPVAPSNAAPIL